MLPLHPLKKVITKQQHRLPAWRGGRQEQWTSVTSRMVRFSYKNDPVHWGLASKRSCPSSSLSAVGRLQGINSKDKIILASIFVQKSGLQRSCPMFRTLGCHSRNLFQDDEGCLPKAFNICVSRIFFLPLGMFQMLNVSICIHTQAHTNIYNHT